MWVRTFFLMPKERTIPWPVPSDYEFDVMDWIPAIRTKSEREIQDQGSTNQLMPVTTVLKVLV